MSDFVQFCRSHGVLIDYLPPIGQWVRVRTADKPRHRNGSVKWMGDFGLVQNWATMEEPACWKGDVSTQVKARAIADRKAADKHALVLAQKAAQKASSILSECELATHPYFERKGFPDQVVNVWNGDVAVVPMYRGRDLVGLQMIDTQGGKKFLFGQRSGGAEFVLGQKGIHVLCEGFATALSAQAVLRNLKVPYSIHVTFSAGNMKRIAEGLPSGVVLADNDASGTGERVAKEIGWPYWMSDVVGEDFNDAHMRLGTFSLAMKLKGVMRRN